MVLDAQLTELPSQSQSLNQCEKVNAIFFFLVHMPHDPLFFVVVFVIFVIFLVA